MVLHSFSMSKFLIVSFVIHFAFIKQKELLLNYSPSHGCCRFLGKIEFIDATRKVLIFAFHEENSTFSQNES